MKPTDKLAIAVRAYTEAAGGKSKGPREPGGRIVSLDEPSQWALVFDCETRISPNQSMRVGAYQVRDGDKLHEEGLFFDPDVLSDDDLRALRAYADAHGLKLRTLWEFTHRVFYPIGYERHGSIIGFNLPFDLSRIAIRHAEARGSLRGGFSFELSKDRRYPRVRVKHLSRRAALIDFAAPTGQDTPRGMRRRGLRVDHHRGFFVDVKTIAAALKSRSFSLASLCDALNVETPKGEAEHGQAITPAYLDYARRDVQATWECFTALRAEYAGHGLATPLHRILSEASIGKAYLKEMGLKPLLECRPDTSRALFGRVMCAYYGGRAEVNLRRVPREVAYVDFKSMYPTVNALMGLWRFVIADGFTWRVATAEVCAFLEAVILDHMHDPASWPWLTAIVRLKPDGDRLPVRAPYDDKVNTIGLNDLTCDTPLWFTLADVVTAKLLTGKTPEIEEAIIFEPGPPQEGLRPIELFGRPEFRIDPYEQDAFKRLIDLRDEAKARKDDAQKAIKIVANATSYGIFVEVNRDDAPKPEPITVYGPDGDAREIKSTAIEQPGNFFNPVIATLITGAARLMLALAERKARDEGLDWVFCDTDSLALARPDGMSEAEFYARVSRVVAWFEALNPYEKPGSILQLEDVNFDLETGGRRPLFAFAISAKRYALFNLDADGRPIIRKASAHGLGHLIAPYGAGVAPKGIPAPSVSLAEIGVARWQYDLWFKIIVTGLSETPHFVPLDYHHALQRPAVSRYGATSPRLLRWFKTYNEGRAFRDQVKPFNFMTAFQGKNGIWDRVREEVLDALPGRGRPKKTRSDVHPVAPFETDYSKAVAQAFDRETGEAVAADRLMTYAEALAHYHLSPESKFANAEAFDVGHTRRRHVVADGVRLIGKESNRLDDELPANVLGDDVAKFGDCANDSSAKRQSPRLKFK